MIDDDDDDEEASKYRENLFPFVLLTKDVSLLISITNKREVKKDKM